MGNVIKTEWLLYGGDVGAKFKAIEKKTARQQSGKRDFLTRQTDANALRQT